jgi:hypothetical protein
VTDHAQRTAEDQLGDGPDHERDDVEAHFCELRQALADLERDRDRLRAERDEARGLVRELCGVPTWRHWAVANLSVERWTAEDADPCAGWGDESKRAAGSR